MTKALGQILDNALKFTNSGFIQFGVDVIETAASPNLIFEVSDSGIGIPEEDFEKIFEKFTQVDSSATRNYEGVGIGLALTQKLVSILGGKIEIQSELGAGSTFKIQVPVKILENSSVQEAPVKVVRSSKIMIVEDNKTNQLLTKRIVKKMGHEAILAENGLVALQLLKTNKPDLILMDCMMPQMDGYEATRLIRAGSEMNDLPIIALTANNLDGDREKVYFGRYG